MCNKKNKIAFVCSTYVQIMRMFQIKKEIPEFYGKADLYLVHDMFNNMEFIRRLENTNEFDNVFYFNDFIELKKHINYLLNYPVSNLANEFVKNNHTFKHQVENIINLAA